MTDGFLTVKVNVPLDDYRWLHAEASKAGVQVAELIARRIARPVRRSIPHRPGRPSAYTSRAGEEISAGRRFGSSWREIGRRLGISTRTAREWLAKHENEVRDQNLRDRAERTQQ